MQVLLTHAAKDLDDMGPEYLNARKRTLMHKKDLDSKVEERVQTILLRNANYMRQHWGLVLEDILTLQFMLVEFLAVNGRADRQLPEILATQEAIINVNIHHNRCFGFAVRSTLNPQ